MMKCVLVVCFAFIVVTTALRDDMMEKDILLIRNHLSFNVSLFSMDPVQVSNNDVTYYLFTKKHRNLTIKNTFNAINRKYPVKILVHGWTEHADVGWCMNTIKAYLRRGFYNIISVDWSSKGDTDYLSASRNSKPVGDKIGDFVIKLHKARKIPFRNVHLVSHSLGCHVAGFVGQRVFESTGEKIARITAMDPAAPLFDVTPTPNMRLSNDDAKLVDIIHTDGGMLGFRYSIGTVDFYPNGGSAIQPGCSLLKPDVKYDDCKYLCNLKKWSPISLGYGECIISVPGWYYSDFSDCFDYPDKLPTI